MKKLSLLAVFSILTIFASARKFYISSSTGSDAYTYLQAQNSTTPWASLKKVNDFANTSNTYPNFPSAGDTFAFKCGDIFTNGYNSATWPGALVWWGNGRPGGWVAPSGTALHPIVFTSYGTGNKPNLLYSTSTTSGGNNRFIFNFSSVKYIVVDGLQFNDYRFNVNDKVSTAYTTMGINIEGSGVALCDNVTIKNCFFSNIGYGIQANGTRINILNDSFVNMKNVGDTSGAFDIGAVPILVSGKYHQIRNNFMKGGWAFTGWQASGQGLNGGCIEILNDFDSSFVGYNTAIDCAGFSEMGNNGSGTGANSPDNDTFAYNKIINCGNIGYINSSLTSTRTMHYWNNVFIENQYSRFSGPRFGTDIYSDGQSFASFPNWPSYPQNISIYNYSAHRPMQASATYSADTLVDLRNNVYWMTTGLQALYPTTKTNYLHRNNIFHLMGSYTYPTVLGTGAALGTGDISTTSKVFVDTTNIHPELWDLHLNSTSVGISAGTNVGLTRDFENNIVTNPPDIGVYQNYNIVPIATCIFTYGQWSACNGSYQTRPYTSSPSNCIGTPTLDSIQRNCINPIVITSFYYNSSKRSVYIKCNLAGIMTISNVSGSVTRTASYIANGQWINVNTLPRGTYFAATYGQSITFIR